jgi:AcrR family transcriptional regulator
VLRNRDALLAAAREVFAAQGLDAPLEHIARRAGLGIATLYRHFPSRHDLIDAILAESVRRHALIAEEALAMDDPWDGLVHFLDGTCRLEATDRSLNDMMSMRIPAAEQADQAKSELYGLAIRIMRRAQDSGQLRSDVTPQDLPLLTWANARIQAATAGIAPDAWRRHLGLLLDGFRASAAHPLPEPPMTHEQVYRAMLGLGDRCTG